MVKLLAGISMRVCGVVKLNIAKSLNNIIYYIIYIRYILQRINESESMS